MSADSRPASRHTQGRRRGPLALLARSRASGVILVRLAIAYGLMVGLFMLRPGLLYDGFSAPDAPGPPPKDYQTAHLLLSPQVSLPIWRRRGARPETPALLVIPGPATPLAVAARRVEPLAAEGWAIVLASQTGLKSPAFAPLIPRLMEQVRAWAGARPLVVLSYGEGALALVNGLDPAQAERLTGLILESPPISQQDTAARALSLGPVPLIPVRALLPPGLALRPALDRLVVPTLLVSAEADPIWTAERRLALREALPRGRISLETVADAAPHQLSAALVEQRIARWVDGLMTPAE